MTETMLAGRLNTATSDFAVVEVPVPEPGPGQVRIRVEAAGVCLSDVHLIDGSLKPLFLKGDSVTLGHETAGVVDVLGPDVGGPLVVGRRVLLLAGQRRDGVVLTRGVDYDGGWAEYAVADADTVLPIPDDLPFEQAAIIPDAVSTPYAAVVATGAVQPGTPVGVWGVGGLGAHAVQVLRAVGAAPIIAVDPLHAARERALDFGADVAVDAAAGDAVQRIRDVTGGGLDLALDVAGVPAVREQAVRSLTVGGRLVLVGLTDQPLAVADGTSFSYFQKQIRGHYGSEPEHLEQILALVRGRRLEFSRSITDVLPLKDAPRAVDRMLSKEGNPIRLVLRP